MLEFREAICNKLIKENEIKYDPKDVLVSNGEKQSLYTACQALFDKGDNVIIFTPYWASFPEFIRLSDAEPNFVKTISNKNFEPDFEQLQNKKDKNTKGVIINSPSNPTGGVWRDETILKLLKIAKRNDWYVISDECYERLTYDKKFTSVENIKNSLQETLTNERESSKVTLSTLKNVEAWKTTVTSDMQDNSNLIKKQQNFKKCFYFLEIKSGSGLIVDRSVFAAA